MKSELLRERLPSIDEIISMRNRLHWSQQKLSAKTGVPRGTIGRMEKGEYYPSHDKVVKILDVLYRHLDVTRKPMYKICARKIISLSTKATLDEAACTNDVKFSSFPFSFTKTISAIIPPQIMATFLSPKNLNRAIV